jgi:amino acid transporter
MRRIDHTGIYVLIAGTYTPVCLLVLGGPWRWAVLVIVYAGAGTAVVLKFAWVEAPRWVAAALGLALGWVGVAALPQLATRLNPAAVALIGVGGLAFLGLQPATFGSNLSPFFTGDLLAFGRALVLIFWAYAGFELSTLPTDEVDRPAKTIPRATPMPTPRTAIRAISRRNTDRTIRRVNPIARNAPI